MLSDRERELLTAYVDGELRSRRRRLAQRLLELSGEARVLFAKLQQDACRLGDLSPEPLGHDLSIAVLGAIAERKLSPRGKPVPATSPYAGWVGVSAAAAVLIGLGAASYLFFSESFGPEPASAIARSDSSEFSVGPGREAASSPGVPERSSEPKAVTKGSPTAPQPPPNLANPTEVANAEEMPAPTPLRESPKNQDVLTGRMEMFQIDQVELSVPLLFKVHQLEQERVRQQLVAELRKDKEFRLELPLPGRSSAKGVERLLAACRTLGIAPQVDPVAQERLKLPQLAANHFAIYLENLSADTMARMIQLAGQEDKKAAGRKVLEIQFDRLVVTRMTSRDRKELSLLLGTDPTQAPTPTSIAPNLKQPLSDLTAQQVGDALAGQGGVPRPNINKASSAAGEGVALVLAYAPTRPHPVSAETKRFLEGRKSAHPGTLRVLLVIRS
jgi:hypothetical protein